MIGTVKHVNSKKYIKVFENFPSEVIWHNAIFSSEELQSVMYIDYSYWNELSNKSRLPIEAAKNVLNGIKVYNVSNDGFKEIHSEIKKGMTFPKMIFVSCNGNS